MTRPTTSLTSFDEYVTYLRRRLAASLPGTEAQLTMAPAYRQDPTVAQVDGKSCREASVLALLFPADDTPHLVFTARRDDLDHHPGQISFPGGRPELGDDDLRDTALREAREEIGLLPDDVDILGMLTPLYIPPSNFCVYPFVGAVRYAPTFTPEDEEVDTILTASLSHLLAPETLRHEPWILHGREVIVPFFAVEEHQIWGATAMMLAELLALFSNTEET